MEKRYFPRWTLILNDQQAFKPFAVAFILPIVLCCVQLSGCSTLSKKNRSENTSQEAAKDDNLVPSTAAPLSPSDFQPFDKETLYDLITAEMAAKDARLDITLGNYLKQAHYTKDPAVVARALRIAQYMKAYQATLDAARLWLSIEPNNQEALQTATIELIRIGRFRDAIDNIDTLLQQSATIDFDFLVEHSRPLGKEDRTEIIKQMASLLQKYPTHPQLWFTKALLEGQNSDNETALKDVNQTLFLKKDYLSAIFFKAKLLQTLDKGSEAIALLQKTLSSESDKKRVRITLAKTYLELNQLEKAQQEFEILVANHPNDHDLKLSLALISWENKLEERAIFYLESLINNGHKLAEAHTYLGNIFAQNQENEKAIQQFRHIRQGPFYVRAQIYIAQLQAQQDQIDAAVSTLQNARSQSPHSAIELYIAESDILTEAKRYNTAFDLLSAALSSFPNNPGLLYTRSLVAEKMDRLGQLETDLRAIIAIDPNSALALNALGYTLADRTDRLEEALKLVQQAMSQEPNDPAIIDSLGWVYFKMGDHQKAIYFLQKAYDILPDGEIAAHLGEVFWVLNKETLAKKIWREALNKSPNHPLLTETLQRLGVTLP